MINTDITAENNASALRGYKHLTHKWRTLQFVLSLFLTYSAGKDIKEWIFI
jgi:hypothetical protein